MEQPSMDLLAGRAYPEVARAFRDVTERVMRRWGEVVQEVLPSADPLTLEQIRDDLPLVLDYVAKAIESNQPFATRQLERIAPKHGETRFHQQFKLDELMTEYCLLRPIVVEEVVAKLDRPMSVSETSALMVALDLVIRQTALEFVAHQTTQLQAANESQSKYLSFLSHDLRGGLNGVCLMIEVLRRELQSEPRFQESVEDLDMMRRSIFETIGTMDRFLHAERFRKGKVQVRPSKVNLNHLLMDVKAQFLYLAKDKDVQLTTEVPADSAVMSDKDLLLMVLQNVTSNAIKYGPRAPVTITATPDEQGSWRLSVADEGPGIPPDKLAELFAPFNRGANAQGQPGVGLGLSIARQAADMLGAKLWAESDGKKGTTFHLQFSPIVK